MDDDLVTLRLRVNGQDVELEVAAQRRLVDVLREELHLPGTHIGCGTGDCGACTVLVDGKSTKSCLVLAMTVATTDVQTIEGLADGEHDLSPVQQAFLEGFGFQCGYCLPGTLLVTMELLNRVPDPTDRDLVDALRGVICRCTGYQGIRDSALIAAVKCRPK